MWIWIGLVLLLAFTPLSQREGQPVGAVIDAKNIGQLRSVSQINFADFPPDVGEVTSGWFVANRDASLLLVKTRDERMIAVEDDGDVLSQFATNGADGAFATILDAAASSVTTPFFASLASDGAGYILGYDGLFNEWSFSLPLMGGDIPLSVWIDDSPEPLIWVEFLPAMPEQPEYIRRFPLPDAWGDVLEEFTTMLPNVAENDPDSIIRIGRILPPQAVTVTEDSTVKLWDLESGALVRSAQAEGGLPVFGAINAAVTHFVWRGNESSAIHLLNLQTGENRVLVPDAPRVDWLFMGAAGDVVVGVGYDGEPSVVVWDTSTGIEYNLGEHRTCNRPPDTVRLSRDGTTLVIGCDTGLDLWRVEGTTP